MTASLQADASDAQIAGIKTADSAGDVPRVIPGLHPAIVDLDDETNQRSGGTPSESTKYVHLGPQIDALSRISDLVFHGRVTDIEYTDAVKNGRSGYPITYVTFSITQILQGRYDFPAIVLMMDGMGWVPPTSFTARSDLPILARDDEVVIFLAAGKVNGPRYIHHFFVVDGETYDSESRQLLWDDHKRIWRGPFNPKTKVLERPIGVGPLTFVQEHVDPGILAVPYHNRTSAQRSLPAGFTPLGMQDFNAHVVRAARFSSQKRPPASNRLSPNRSVESADKTMRIYFPLGSNVREKKE